jgi:cytochrome P450
VAALGVAAVPTQDGRVAYDVREVPRAGGNRLGLLRALRRDPTGTFARLRREYGTMVAVSVPGLRLYLLSDPAAIQEALTHTNRSYAKGLPRSGDPSGPGIQPLERILGRGLLTSYGELWRHQRRLVQPLFHHARVAGYAATFARLAAGAGAGWRDGEVRDMHREMTELTLAIVARTVFDVDLDTEVVAQIRRSLATNLSTARRAAVPWGRLADRLPLPSTRRWNADRAALDALVYDLIARRRAAEGEGGDLLSLLLSARDEETGEGMPDEQVRDEAVTMLLAGHETTASALAFAFHLLGANPAAQEELGAELDGVLGGRLPGADDVPRLRYTTAVLHDTMRLYPPAWMLARRLVQPREVGGYRLPAGSLVVFCPWVVHRDPAWWPEPEAFRPRRWLSADAGERPRYAYFPFGGGPRQCIGNTFAELEAVVVLATLCRHWRVAPVPGASVGLRALVTLRPAAGVPMYTARRV